MLGLGAGRAWFGNRFSVSPLRLPVYVLRVLRSAVRFRKNPATPYPPRSSPTKYFRRGKA